MIRIIKEHTGVIGYGVLLTFFSGFGQTFFISLLVPFFISSVGISHADFGSLYAIITLASAFTLIYVGKFIDKWPVRKFTLFVVLLLAASLLLVALSYNQIVLCIGLWGIRLAGQGLLPHTSSSFISRRFNKDRGRALSLVTLGHPLGEAILPMVLVVLLSLLDWRLCLGIGAIFLMVILLPYIALIPIPNDSNISEDKDEKFKIWTQKEVLKSRHFFTVVPAIFIPTLLTTALFLYQIPLAEEKGWTAQWIAFCLTGFAIARVIASLFSGTIIDRYGAKNIFPFHLIPFIIGLLILFFSNGSWAAYVYMFLTGMSMGLGSTIKSALLADIFGVASIGAVRSLFSTVMVISTAVGPALFGYLLNQNVSFNHLIVLSIILALVSVIWSLKIISINSYQRTYLRIRKVSVNYSWRIGVNNIIRFFKTNE